jgi:hypothetical protein
MTSSSSSLSPQTAAERELARSQATFLSEQIVSLRAKTTRIEQDSQQVAAQFKSLSQMNTTLGDDLGELNEEISWLEQQIQPLSDAHAKLESRRAHLQSLIANLRSQILADEREQECVTKIRRLESKTAVALAELQERRPGEPLEALEEAKLTLSESIEELQDEQKDLEDKRELLSILIAGDQTLPEKLGALDQIRLARQQQSRALQDELAGIPQTPFAPRRPKRATPIPQPTQTDAEKDFHEMRRQKLLSQYKPDEPSSLPQYDATPTPTPTPTPSPPPGRAPATPPATPPRPPPPPRVCSDFGTQTNEAEMRPFVAARLPEISGLCKLAAAQIERAAAEFAAKTKVIHDGQHELESNVTVLSQSPLISVSITPRRSPVQALGLIEFKRRNQAVVTEITSAILDLHRETLEKQLEEAEIVRDLRATIENFQKEIKLANRRLFTSKKQNKIVIEKIKQTKEDTRKAKSEAELEEQNRLLILEKDDDDRRKRVQMAADIRQQQRLLAQRQTQNAEAAAKWVELSQMKESLEFDLEDMTHREKLRVQALIRTVGFCDSRADDTRQKLTAAEEELKSKQQLRNELKHSQECLNLRDLIVRRLTLERRIEKWTGILKNPRYSIQVMIDYSAVNALHRQNLVGALKKGQRAKLNKEEELREFENYIALLSELLREQHEHWR